MPLFGKQKQKMRKPRSEVIERDPDERGVLPPIQQMATPHALPPSRPKLVFHCQLAHGSLTGVISDFINVKELYQKIAGCYNIDDSEILFCTLNTHKVDMSKLLGGQLGLDDFLFAHIKGHPKVVDIEKTDDSLGLTITDNGAGYSFIKVIKNDSIIAGINGICTGDHIEKVDDELMVGLRHFEVAKRLKNIPKGTTFRLRVIEPMKSGFSEIGGKSAGPKKSNYGSGKETLRLRSNSQARVEVVDELMNIAVEKINSLLESFLGISDTELAQSIWETGSAAQNPSDFSTAVENSELCDFGFTESFIFDMWGAISDAKQGRLEKYQDFNNEKF